MQKPGPIKERLTNRVQFPGTLCTPDKGYMRGDPPHISQPIGVADGLNGGTTPRDGIAIAWEIGRPSNPSRRVVVETGGQRFYRI